MPEPNKIENQQIDFSKLEKNEDIDVLLDEEITKNDDVALTEEPTPPEAPVTDTPKDTEVEEPVTPEKPVETPGTPPEAPEKDTAKDTAVADAFLDSLDEEDRKTLEKYKGKPIPEVLKALANAQRLVGARAEKLKESLGIKPETPTPAEKTVPEPIKMFKLDPEGENAKTALINKQLKAEYPNLPDDPNERKDFLADLNYKDPEEFQNYLQRKNAISAEVDQVVKTTQYLTKNSGAVNLQRINEAKGQIKDYFKKLNIEPKDFDIDIDKDDLENPYLNEVVADENGNFYDDIVQVYNGVSIIKPGTIAQKFFEKHLPTILSKLPERYRKEGYEAASKKSQPGVPTLGIQKPGTPQKKEEVTLDKINSLNSVEEIDALLDKMT